MQGLGGWFGEQEVGNGDRILHFSFTHHLGHDFIKISLGLGRVEMVLAHQNIQKKLHGGSVLVQRESYKRPS